MTTMAPPKIEPLVRLIEIVNDAEEERSYEWIDDDGEEKVESFSLIDAEHAQRLREEYHERAEVMLRAFGADERKGRPLVRL